MRLKEQGSDEEEEGRKEIRGDEVVEEDKNAELERQVGEEVES